ncbi:imelysin family protein [Roseovarius arcticus]|uniref:imelysin family protein n=1 Tax=Roseovarius arcticus TaxID=2547404 RepID=UPI001110E294|nr:imelysin family protein [Roseovarius arcticus]
MRLIPLCLALLLPATTFAQTAGETAQIAVTQHILPRYEALAKAGETLATTAQSECSPDAPALTAAYSDAFDAWIAASHLRFGPSEAQDRAFALAFWPDTRGITPRALAALIDGADPVARDPSAFAGVSIAARGFYALEFLLYDPEIRAMGEAEYRCELVRAVATDIAALSADILNGWQGGYADKILNTGQGSPYRSDEEAVQELFKALTFGLEITSDTRLGRPLGTFDKPRPKRAEAWRAGRSLRNIALSLASLDDLAGILAQRDTELQARLKDAFRIAIADAEALDDPILAGVADPLKRLRVESLQQSINQVREIVRDDLGPELGVAPGFNAMDGD